MRKRALGLSPRQAEMLGFIQRWIKDHGYPPAVREIGQALGLRSSSTVHMHLKQLEAKGYLKRNSSKPRAIEITANRSVPTEDVVEVPVLGRVAAGQPLLAEENREGTFPLPASLARRGTTFLLRVRGDSMVEAGILDGDFVLVRQQPAVENGEIAVALLGDEATVKRFYKENGYVRLQPENRVYEPIMVRSVQILGKVIGVFRLL
ncbi:MAG TPA: transcriptional repressor LexA [Firmicutes bacterium]|jgi:repressor LexA|uniref:transcriptional repressor LexA n=1 Tax=Gelria sp. Kuro-4 TaxID=2796927 RepID=UPI0019AB8043|nr:transcriptional repressor LexA [Gelria sp. Kuro-4]MDK2927941.1 repressor LexA [Bacillota bacterium]BCV25045.1 LexA repressor [Gelria sp. Kuro-4]HHV56668.1 transcriptional repressor LexA [Bacillota bacterium]